MRHATISTIDPDIDFHRAVDGHPGHLPAPDVVSLRRSNSFNRLLVEAFEAHGLHHVLAAMSPAVYIDDHCVGRDDPDRDLAGLVQLTTAQALWLTANTVPYHHIAIHQESDAEWNVSVLRRYRAR